MADEKINIIVSLKDNASKAIVGIKDNFSKLATVGNLLAGGTIAGIAKGLGKLVDAFGESEGATIKLRSALSATGQEVENNTDSMLKFASHLEDMTTIGDDAAVGLMQIATSMGLTADQAKLATQNAVGLSAAYGVDLQSGIKMASAAAAGNYDMLKRTIPELKNIKDESELAARAQKLLGAAFQVAKDETKTYQGAMLQLGNQINNAQEVLGKALAPAFTAVAKTIGSVVGFFNDLTPSTQQATGVLVGITAVVSALAIAFTVLTWPVVAAAAAIAGLVAGFIYLKEATAPLSEKTNQLTKEHEKLEEKIISTKDQMAALAAQGKENGSEYLKLQNELAKTNKELTTNEQKLRDNIKALADQKKAIEDKIAAQKGEVSKAKGDKKIKELEELEALEAQKKEIIAASKDAETELLLQKNEEQNAALTAQQITFAEIKKQYEDEMKAANIEKQIADQQAEIAYKDQLFQAELAKLGADEAAKAQLTAQYNRVRAADSQKLVELQNKQKEQQSKDFSTWENFMLQATTSKNKEVAAIAKALAIKNIIFQTGQAAMSAYSSMAAIPLVGPVLGAAAAGAALAFGAEQINTVQSQGTALAEGGIVMPTPGGTQATIGEAGSAEAVIPLDDPEAKSMLGGAGGGSNNITVNISGKPLAKEMYEIQQEMIRTGELSA